jgi:uncharacterized membrane protein affecting hemolysin expression
MCITLPRLLQVKWGREKKSAVACVKYRHHEINGIIIIIVIIIIIIIIISIVIGDVIHQANRLPQVSRLGVRPASTNTSLI